MQAAPVDFDTQQFLDPDIAQVDVAAEMIEQRELAGLVRRLERGRL